MRRAGLACTASEKLHFGTTASALFMLRLCSFFAQEPLMRGLIERIAILVLDSSGSVVERFNMQLKVDHLC